MSSGGPLAVREQRHQVAGLLGAPAGRAPLAVRRRPGAAQSASPLAGAAGGDVDDLGEGGQPPLGLRGLARAGAAEHQRAPRHVRHLRGSRPTVSVVPSGTARAPERREPPAAVRAAAARRGPRWTATTSVVGADRARPPAAGPARRAARPRPSSTRSYGVRRRRARASRPARSRAAGRAAAGRRATSPRSRCPARPSATARTRCPVMQRQPLPVGHPGGLRAARPASPRRGRRAGATAGPAARPPSDVPGAGRGERRAGGQVEQQDPVDEQAVAARARGADGERAGGAGAVGAGQALGGAGAEQSQFHGTIVSRPVPRARGCPPCGDAVTRRDRGRYAAKQRLSITESASGRPAT